MEAFKVFSGLCAVLNRGNVDTDLIIPKQFLKTIKRTGLGKSVFYELRYDEEGQMIPDFLLNRSPYNRAKILITGENFGCGSSREHAPWALLDFGFRVIIASSFADIFYNNCFKNGILPVILDEAPIKKLESLAEDGKEYHLEVDLEQQEIRGEGIEPVSFEIDAHKRYCLLNGLDDIDQTLAEEELIQTYEEESQRQHPRL